MKKRSFDEMIAYFNRRVSEMDIDRDYKMELLGMVTAIGYKHEKTAQQWIPCSERLPEKCDVYLVTGGNKVWTSEWVQMITVFGWANNVTNPVIIAWMPLPEPARLEETDD